MKFRRGRHHGQVIQIFIQQFLNTNPYQIVPEPDPKANDRVIFRAKVREQPPLSGVRSSGTLLTIGGRRSTTSLGNWSRCGVTGKPPIAPNSPSLTKTPLSRLNLAIRASSKTDADAPVTGSTDRSPVCAQTTLHSSSGCNRTSEGRVRRVTHCPSSAASPTGTSTTNSLSPGRHSGDVAFGLRTGTMPGSN